MNQREKLLEELLDAQDEAYDLMVTFDSQLHRYGDMVIYGAEVDIIVLIGSNPGITVTELANLLRRTPSACSQMVRKLRTKGWVIQERNPDNNRVYNLVLSEQGSQIYRGYRVYQREYRQRTSAHLDGFSEQELESHLRIQRKLNASYRNDVDWDRDRFKK